jgi:preprotein translocase subunit SecE
MKDKNKKNPLKGIANYFREVRSELKKVVWPTLKQIKNNTIIVIISLVFVGAIIWVLDLGFGATLGNVVDWANDKQSQQQIDQTESFPIEQEDNVQVEETQEQEQPVENTEQTGVEQTNE